MSYKEESKILKDCDNCGDDENGNTPKNSDSDKQNPDNEEKRISNPDELIIVKDQDKEMKFKYPIKDDDEYSMYMIPDSIDEGKSLKSAEEYSKKNSASHSLQRKRERSKSESSNHYCDKDKDNEYDDFDNKEDKSNSNEKELVDPKDNEVILDSDSKKYIEFLIGKAIDAVVKEIIDNEKNNDTIPKDENENHEIDVDVNVIGNSEIGNEHDSENEGKNHEED